MAEGIRGLLRGSKDAALGYTARSFFNTRLHGIGEMTEFSIDTKSRTFRLRLDLVGETEPIEINVGRYELKRRGDETSLKVLDATASRPWLAEALRQFVVGRSFTVPAGMEVVLKLLT